MTRYIPLLWSTLHRKPTRLVITTATVAVAFALFGLLQGFTLGARVILDEISETLMVVRTRTALLGAPRLPIAHLGVLRGLEGVEAVAFLTGLPAYFQEPTKHDCRTRPMDQLDQSKDREGARRGPRDHRDSTVDSPDGCEPALHVSPFGVTTH